MIEGSFFLSRDAFCLDLAFSLPEQGVTAILGPSGSGKTTFLRCLAGLERQVQGRLKFGTECWQEGRWRLPPHRRAVAYVFQEASLFEPLSVQGNLEYAYRRVPLAQRRLDWDTVVAGLHLESLLARRPQQLSGGERQRVALGRALLSSPRLLLMDEPLSALDLQTRASLLPLIESLQRQFQLSVVYVSHWPEELARLADQLLIFQAGRLHAQGPLVATLLNYQMNLQTPQAGDRLAVDQVFSVLECVLETPHLEHGLSLLRFWPGGDQTLRLPEIERPVGQKLRLRVLARDVSLCLDAPQRSSILNILPARIVALAPVAGGQRLVRLALAGQELLALLSEYSCAHLGLAPAQDVYAQIKAVALLG